MTNLVKSFLFLAIAVNSVISYEDYEDNSNDHVDYEHVKQQFMNLQAAQRGIHKKADDIPAAPLSGLNIQKALKEMKQDYSRVQNWPTPSKKLGAVSAVALDVYKNVVVFHRAERVWNSETFNGVNVFLQRNLGPIKDNTIIIFDRETGNVLNEWGSNLFYLPHGLHINGNYYYVTDVGMHQVFRFNVKNSTTKPELVLGNAFTPGSSSKSFCKPTSVASLENGDFFVADGYCNSRILKFNFKGEKILEWGRSSFAGSNGQALSVPNSFAVPHALTLVPEKELLCVADRENGRVQCFNWSDGNFNSQYHSPIVGDRLFSVDYANETLFVVNGPEFRKGIIEIRGFTFDMKSGDVNSKFGSFSDPHDIAVTSDAKEIYVGDLSADENGQRVYKFMLNGMKPTYTSDFNSNVPTAKANAHRGDTALLVGSIVLLFTILTIGIAILISRKRRQGTEENEYHSLMTK